MSYKRSDDQETFIHWSSARRCSLGKQREDFTWRRLTKPHLTAFNFSLWCYSLNSSYSTHRSPVQQNDCKIFKTSEDCVTKFILLLVSNLFWRCLIERKRHCLKEKPAEKVKEKVKDSMTWQKKLNNRVSHSINPKRLQLSIYSVEVGLSWTRILAPFTSMCVIELNTEHSVSNTFQQDRHHCFVRLVRK